MSEPISSTPLLLFYSYAHEDALLRDQLETHLAHLHRQGLLSSWHYRAILPGENRAQEIHQHLNSANIILLLISSNFLASDYCYQQEMTRALERHQRGEAHVIPILLRPCSWQSAPFGFLQVLPHNGRAITSWTDRDEAFLDIETNLRALITHFPQTNAVISTNAAVEQNREQMIGRLQAMYEDLLKDSLQEVNWIDLGISTRPEAIQNAANLVLQRSMQTAHQLPPGTSIRQIYQEANQELLLLGKPGVGKSTLLYRLGKELLQEARVQTHRPLPVLFSLSNWARMRQPLQEWLVEYLASPRYEIQRTLGQQWIQQRQILPLLDGLDEMPDEAQSACIAAINSYRREHALCPLVICSRSTEYTRAANREQLHLQCAVEIQPLTPEQLEETLGSMGEPFAPLRIELRRNSRLRELACIPLWLNVLLLTFRDEPVGNLPEKRAELQRHLFQRYIQRMVAQKGQGTDIQRRYPHDSTVRWLAWLAGQMNTHNLTEFAIEMLQPDWLVPSRRAAYQGSVALLLGSLVGLAFALGGSLTLGPQYGLGMGMTFGGLNGRLFGERTKIELADRLHWSLRNARRDFPPGLRWGLLIGLPLGLAERWLFDRVFGLPGEILTVLLCGLACGLFFVAVGGMQLSLLPDRSTLLPGEGLRRSLRHGLTRGLIVTLCCGLCGMLVAWRFGSFIGKQFFGLLSGPPAGLFLGLLLGLGFGLFVALWSGLLGVFQHLILRFWLKKTDSFPFQARDFLEDARARHLLQRAGGSYLFVHRLLQDYLADLSGQPSSARSPRRRASSPHKRRRKHLHTKRRA